MEKIVLAGAGGAIGGALLRLYSSERKKPIQIYALCRKNSPSRSELESFAHEKQSDPMCKVRVLRCEPTCEQEVEAVCKVIAEGHGHLSMFVNTIGALNIDDHKPEKSLGSVSTEYAMKSFEVNVLPTLLFAKHLLPCFQHKMRSVFVSLSARVGSIEDNHMGGWYSYRMSKAALNMGIKNIFLEYSRRRTNCVVSAVHPGTTHSRLTEGYTNHLNYSVKEASETADILAALFAKISKEEHGGKLINFDGELIEW